MIPEDVIAYGQIYRRLGLTPRRIFRRLQRQFPSVEYLDLKIAAGEGPTGIRPSWAEQHPIHPVVVRSDPRKVKTVEVKVRDVKWEELMGTFPLPQTDKKLREIYEKHRARIKEEKRLRIEKACAELDELQALVDEIQRKRLDHQQELIKEFDKEFGTEL